MADDGYSRRNVYRNVGKELENMFNKVVNTPSKINDFVFEPKARIGGNVRLFKG